MLRALFLLQREAAAKLEVGQWLVTNERNLWLALMFLVEENFD